MLTTLTNVHQIVASSRLCGYPDTRPCAWFPLAARFTSFNCEATSALHEGENFVVIYVNNTRKAEGVPTLSTDWWNYGGLTRDVLLVEVPETFVQIGRAHV